ncbi:glypican-6-like [Artemia franciscana]|uniref:Glypican-6 n=1 Tax=Artemia franciscana TaxID=6661 RepID=A0AA88I1C4_ARTSF|nr:hypothetical protein QYM36_005336 [Artemia franciscana]KAK2719825.1 hypothetical protein QYM36_005336 [Artemia franciscana]
MAKSLCMVQCFLYTLVFYLQLNKITGELACSSVRYAYSGKGIAEKDIPMEPVAGSNLRVCTQEMTCCTEAMEMQLSVRTRQDFDQLLKESAQPAAATFIQKAKQFDEYFKELLDRSKKDFHDMFKKTYGVLYEQNSIVFTDLFADLESYYSRGKPDLEVALDAFFTRLYQRMFRVLNGQYTIDETYLNCVSQHMNELKPFEEVPRTLTVQVKRSFVATRTFAIALSVGRDVISKVLSTSPGPECSKNMMKMSHCPACNGLPDLRPCDGYCVGVISACLDFHGELAQEWENYIDALVKVSERLIGPFNIEQVVDPIHIKISEAVMNFQEKGMDITQKIFKGCGQLRLSKREAPNFPDSFQREDSNSARNPHSIRSGGGKQGGKWSGKRKSLKDEDEMSELERMVREIRSKVRSSREVWSALPGAMCKNEKVGGVTSSEEKCWNGTTETKVGASPSASMVASLLSLDDAVARSLVNEQIVALRQITHKLENAHNGVDVSWEADDMESSGSGSGSGFSPDDDEDDETLYDRDSERRNYPTEVEPEQTETEPEEDISFVTQPPPTPRSHPPTTAGSPAANPVIRMTPARAIATYLTPFVVVWLGNWF